MAPTASDGDGLVETQDLGGGHGDGFALGGIDLPRHDRAARFIGGQLQFPETRAGTTGQQPDVINDLVHGPC